MLTRQPFLSVSRKVALKGRAEQGGAGQNGAGQGRAGQGRAGWGATAFALIFWIKVAAACKSVPFPLPAVMTTATPTYLLFKHCLLSVLSKRHHLQKATIGCLGIYNHHLLHVSQSAAYCVFTVTLECLSPIAWQKHGRSMAETYETLSLRLPVKG